MAILWHEELWVHPGAFVVWRPCHRHRSSTAPAPTTCSTSLISAGDGRTRIWELTSTLHPDAVGAARRSRPRTRSCDRRGAREDLAEGFEHSAVGRLPQMDGDLARDALAHRYRAARFPTPGSAPFRRRVRACRAPGRACPFRPASAPLIRLGEHHHLHAAHRIFEREHRHPIAFPRLELAAGGDDAADRGVGLDRLPATGSPAVRLGRRLRIGQIGDGSWRRTPSTRPRSDRPGDRSSTGRASPSRTRVARPRSRASPAAASSRSDRRPRSQVSNPPKRPPCPRSRRPACGRRGRTRHRRRRAAAGRSSTAGSAS